MTKTVINPVIITGAGASKPLGYATTLEFFDEEISRRTWQPRNADTFRFLVETISTGSKDVEDILRLLQPVEDLLKLPAGDFLRHYISQAYGGKNDWAKAIPLLAEQIRDRCFEIYGVRPDDEDVEKLYSPLLKLLNWQTSPLDIFTLNYDLVLDSVLDFAVRESIPVYDGFVGQRSRFDDSQYDNPNNQLRLYHLHGALGWIESGGVILNQRHNGKTDQRHVYIPPGFKGDPIRDGHSEPIQQAHRRLATALGKSLRCVIIGYSFRDAHLNGVIEKALITNGMLTVLVVDPAIPSSPDSSFGNLLDKFKGRFVHVRKKFGDLSVIADLKKYFD